MLTIFSYFKSFNDEYTAMVQTNAMRSWISLDPNPEVIIFGNNPGVKEMCDQYGFRHIPNVRCGVSGTPYMDSMIRVVEEVAFFDKLLFVSSNSVILDRNIYKVAYALSGVLKHYFVICKETLLKKSDMKLFSFNEETKKYFEAAAIKDDAWNDGFYLFNKGYFEHHPPFLLNRGSYNQWYYWYGSQFRKSLVWARDTHVVRQEVETEGQISEFQHNESLIRVTSLSEPQPNYVYYYMEITPQPPAKAAQKSAMFL